MHTLPLASALVLASLGLLPAKAQEEPRAPYPQIWGSGEFADPVPEHAPSPPTDPIEVDVWLWLAGDAVPLSVFQQYVTESATPPRVGEEFGGTTWTSAKPMEGVSWAYARVQVAADEVRMARLTGAEVLFVNGEGFYGDPRRKGFRGVPVALRAGANELFVTGIDGPFELELWSPAKRCVIGTWDVVWTILGVYSGDSDILDDVAFPVFNASTVAAQYLHVHYGRMAPEGAPIPLVTEWRDGHFVAPLGMTWVGTYSQDLSNVPKLDGRWFIAPVAVYADGDDDTTEEPEFLRWQASVSQPRDPRAPSDRNAAIFDGGILGHHPLASHYFVYGTAGTEEENRRSLARARFDQQLVGYLAGRAPLLMSDREILQRAVHAGRPLVLYGNEDINAAWKQTVPGDCGVRVRRGAIDTPDDEVVGDLGGWIDFGDVAAVFDTGPGGSALGYFARWIATPLRDADYAVYAGSVPPDVLEVDRARPLAEGRISSK